MHRYILILITLLSTAILSGCSEKDERNHPLYKKGESARAAGNASEAEECFTELLKRKPESTYAHLQLAAIYDEMLNDPQKAAMHYRLYLDAHPDAADAEEVKAWQNHAEKRYYESLRKRFEPDAEQTATRPQPAAAAVPPPAAPAAPDAQAEAASRQLQALKQENAELKQKVSQYRARLDSFASELTYLRKLEKEFKASAVAAASNQPSATAAAPDHSSAANEPLQDQKMSTYVVQERDNPSKIAYKVYGKSSLYTIILRANPGVTERNLRPGMVLKIPPQPSK